MTGFFLAECGRQFEQFLSRNQRVLMRLGTPILEASGDCEAEDIADAIAWLASDNARKLSGVSRCRSTARRPLAGPHHN